MTAGALLLLWLVVSAISFSPALHHWLHQNSDDASHQCVFTQLNQGAVESAPPAFQAPAPRLSASSLPMPAPGALKTSSDFQFASSRAPPIPLLSLTLVG